MNTYLKILLYVITFNMLRIISWCYIMSLFKYIYIGKKNQITKAGVASGKCPSLTTSISVNSFAKYSTFKHKLRKPKRTENTDHENTDVDIDTHS